MAQTLCKARVELASNVLIVPETLLGMVELSCPRVTAVRSVQLEIDGWVATGPDVHYQVPFQPVQPALWRHAEYPPNQRRTAAFYHRAVALFRETDAAGDGLPPPADAQSSTSTRPARR